MLLDDFTNDLRSILNNFRRALEFKEQAVEFWILSLRNAVDVGRSHKLVVYKLYTLDGSTSVQDLYEQIDPLRTLFPSIEQENLHREPLQLRRGHLGTEQLLHLWAVEGRGGV